MSERENQEHDTSNSESMTIAEVKKESFEDQQDHTEADDLSEEAETDKPAASTTKDR